MIQADSLTAAIGPAKCTQSIVVDAYEILTDGLDIIADKRRNMIRKAAYDFFF